MGGGKGEERGEAMEGLLLKHVIHHSYKTCSCIHVKHIAK